VNCVHAQGGGDAPQRAGPDNRLTVGNVAWHTIRRDRGDRRGTRTSGANGR
jgi:hypothetical protein